MAGQEIYSMLFGRDNVEIKIESLAGSAASVIAMANKSKISPVAMIMIHNVSAFGVSGDYHEMQKMKERLQQMNAAMANSYVLKTGKSLDEVLKLMDKETWLTANQAIELGFVDEIMTDDTQFTNDIGGLRLTDEIRQKVIAEKAVQEAEKQEILSDLHMYGV